MGYTPKFLIDNVSAKLPSRAFAILRKSWEMIMNPDVGVYPTTPDSNCICLIKQRFHNFFERDWNLSLVNILRPKPQTAYVNITKILIVWMIFGNRLLSSFLMSAFYSFLKCLRYTANRQTSLKNYNSGIGFLIASALLSDPWRNLNPCLGRDPYYSNCADESRGARWDGQKNEVGSFSRDAKINTAGSTFSGELQTALLIGFAKQKRKLCHYTTFSVF